MKRIAVDALPDDPLAAAGVFHQHWSPHVVQILAEDDVMIAFPPADYTHSEWRRAVTAMLARAHAPRRVNAVAGREAALDAFERYLSSAPGVTGQYLEAAPD